jgi:hypothetical protein
MFSKQTFTFFERNVTIELTDTNTVKWLLQPICKEQCYYEEFTDSNIPESFGGIANFYHVVVALHKSGLNEVSYNGSVTYEPENDYQMIEINYDDVVKLKCYVTLIKLVEDKPYYITYCGKIADLLPDTVKGTKNDNKYGDGYTFTCKNFDELQTHLDVFHEINPKLTYENLISILKSNFTANGIYVEGIVILLPINFHNGFVTKKHVLSNEIINGLTKLAYERMLAEFK